MTTVEGLVYIQYIQYKSTLDCIILSTTFVKCDINLLIITCHTLLVLLLCGKYFVAMVIGRNFVDRPSLNEMVV